jgi:hypothetical protein
VFLRKSVEEIGRNGVAFLVGAKKRKRVCKSVKTKGQKWRVADGERREKEILRIADRLSKSVPFWEWADWWAPPCFL